MIFLIRSDDKVLLQRRSTKKATFPDYWDSSSSFYVTFGESYEQAGKRELKEETGVRAPLAYLGKFLYHVPPENEMVAVFFCRSDNKIIIDQTESSEGSFHTRDEVNVISESEVAAPWLRMGWKMMTNSNV
jgi:isopentenyldiphosphate isomerase